MKKFDVLKYLSRLLCLAIVVSMSGCGDDDDDDDDDDDVNPLVGTYAFTSAVTNQNFSVMNLPDGSGGLVPQVDYEAGDDITFLLFDTITGAAPCTNPTSARIDLRAGVDTTGGESYYVCTDEDAEELQGAWTDDGTTFTLTVLLSDGSAFPIVLNPYSLVGSVLSGTATIPLPLDAAQPSGAGNIQPIGMEITFTKE